MKRVGKISIVLLLCLTLIGCSSGSIKVEDLPDGYKVFVTGEDTENSYVLVDDFKDAEKKMYITGAGYWEDVMYPALEEAIGLDRKGEYEDSDDAFCAVNVYKKYVSVLYYYTDDIVISFMIKKSSQEVVGLYASFDDDDYAEDIIDIFCTIEDFSEDLTDQMKSTIQEELSEFEEDYIVKLLDESVVIYRYNSKDTDDSFQQISIDIVSKK